MKGSRLYLKFALLAVGILGVWLIYWPIMESIYAVSWDPLIGKMESFIVGIIIVVVDAYLGIRVLL